MDFLQLGKFETLSPFEIKDELIKLAKNSSRATQSAFLNAGRGNPNWVATTPREGYFLLGQFAVTESKRVMDHPAGLGGMPQAQGIAARLEAWLAEHSDVPGASFLLKMVSFVAKKFAFDPDEQRDVLLDREPADVAKDESVVIRCAAPACGRKQRGIDAALHQVAGPPRPALQQLAQRRIRRVQHLRHAIELRRRR